MSLKRLWISLIFLITALAQVQSAALRVNKSGSDFLGTTYTSIQSAVNACTPAVGCDEILITDTEIYEEQVTFDSTKAGIWLHSLDPALPATIRYRDTEAVHPKSGTESQNMNQWFVAGNQYDLNGALRFVFTSDIKVTDIVIDGEKRFMYGWEGVWEFKHPLTGGNVCVLVRNSSKIHIANSEIKNCWNGIYLKGRNLGGQNANPNGADLDTDDNIPLSGYGQAGRALIEYNKIYDNSWAVFGESEWDLGSTIRYNLIYNNYARAGEITSMSNGTADDKYEVGGFLKIKDVTLAIYQIYNNTFWHNHHNVASQWKAGKQHIFYNNIWAKPNAIPEGDWFEFGDKVPNHTYSISEYQNKQALQYQPVTQGNIGGNWLTFDTPLQAVYNFDLQAGGGGTPWEHSAFTKGGTAVVTVAGTAYDYAYTDFFIPPVKSTANNWWYEDIAWQSIDPTSDRFLCPDWEVADVQRIILDQGNTGTGLSDADGSAPDIGALSKGNLNNCVWGGNPTAPRLKLVGTSPLLKQGTKAQITFVVDVENAELDALSNVQFQVIKYYDDVPVITTDDQLPQDNWPVAQVISNATVLKSGANEVVLDVDLGTSNYSNLEVIVKGDINGTTYFSNQEIFQYRGPLTGGGTGSAVERQYNIQVSFQDLSGNPIDSAGAGEAIRVVGTIVDFDGNVAAVAKSTIQNVRTATWLGNKVRPSVWSLDDPAYTNWETTTKTGQPEFASVAALETANIAFSSAGSETLCLSATEGADKAKVVFGCGGITIVPGTAWSLALLSPESSKGKGENHKAALGKGTTNVVVQLFDIFGNPAINDAAATVKLTSDNQAIAVDPTSNGVGSDNKGQVTIPMEVIGELGSTFKLTASFVGGTNNGETDFSNVEVTTPPLGIKVIEPAAIRVPSGTCFELPMAAIDEDGVIQEDAIEFYIEAAGGPTIYRDDACATSVSPTEILTTDSKGLITLYISGVDVSAGSFTTKLKANLLAKSPFPESIVFFSPEIFFIKEDGTRLQAGEMGIKEFMFVSFPLTIGAFFEGSPCSSCNNDIAFDIDTTRFVITTQDGTPINKITLEAGQATFWAYGINEFTDGKITVKSGSKIDTYQPIEIEESPVPYIIKDGAQMFDSNGDGIADSLTLKFNRVFDPDTLPLNLTFKWPNGEESEITLDPSYVKAGTDSLTITPSMLTPNAVTGQLSSQVDTYGPGTVKVYWPNAIIQTGFISQKINDKMGPVLVDARIALLSIWDELTLTFSEPINPAEVNNTGILFEFRRNGEVFKFVPKGANWADSTNRVLIWRFSSEDSVGVKAQSGDSIRIITGTPGTGIVEDMAGNVAHPNNPWIDIVGLRRVTVEYLPFYQGVIAEEDPKEYINKSFEIFSVSNNAKIDELTGEMGSQGFFIPYAFFEGGSKEPDSLTFTLKVHVYTSLGGYITSMNKKISCTDTEIFDRDCLSDRKGLYVNWKYRDINGRKVGSGIYIYQYHFWVTSNGDKLSNSDKEKIVNMGFHRLK